MPVNTMLASEVPSPEVKVRPLRLAKVRVPLATLRVICRLALPASASLTEIKLALADEKTKVWSSSTVCVLGTVLVGASLTAVMEITAESLAVKGPPLPVLPWSLTARDRVSLAGGVSLLMK